MDRATRVLAGLLRASAGLLPTARREWAEAMLAEALEVPAGAGRVAWLGGGLWLVAREVLIGRVMRVVTFAAGAAGMTWIGWPGASSNSATPLNRVYVVGTVLLLALLPVLVRRRFGPVRGGWAPRAARVGGYAMVLALIAAKIAKDRYGSKLGAYFVIVPGLWVLDIVLLLVIAGYVAGLLILTSQRIRLTRSGLPIAIAFGAVTAGVLYMLAPLSVGVDPASPSLKWWGLAGLALPAATGLLVSRLAAREARPAVLTAEQGARQGSLAACCAMATAALLLALLTSVTIALFPHRVPLQNNPPPPAGGGCETCDPNDTVIPPGLRHEYLVELSVGQAGQMSFALLLLAPFLGAGLGAVAGRFASGSRGTSGRAVGGPHAPSPPAPTRLYRRLRESNADREKAIDLLKAAFVPGELIKDEQHQLRLAGLPDVLRRLPAAPESAHRNGPAPGAEGSRCAEPRRWAQAGPGAELTSLPPPLDGTPWSVRYARGLGEQPALEIYEAGECVAVMVATSVAPQLLRGARRASRGGQGFGLAWGRLPADGPAITVTFASGRLRRMGRGDAASEGIRPEVIDIASWCWLAVAAGRLDVVLVSHRGTRERLKLRAGADR